MRFWGVGGVWLFFKVSRVFQLEVIRCFFFFFVSAVHWSFFLVSGVCWTFFVVTRALWSFFQFIGLFWYYSSNRGVFHLFQALGGGYFCHFLAFRRYFGNFDVLGVFRSFFMFRGCISLFLGVKCVLDIFLSF